MAAPVSISVTPASGALPAAASLPPGAAGPDGVFAALLDAAAGALALPQGETAPGQAAPSEAGLSDLIDALAALDLAVDAGQPPDPALLQKLDGLLDQVAALLGIDFSLPLPQSQPTAPAAGDGAAATSPLAALATRFAEIGDGLEPGLAGLAKKLSAVAAKLGQDAPAPDLLAKLGFDAELKIADKRLQQAVEAFLAPRPEAKPTATVPQAFTAPSLPLPATGALAEPTAARPQVAELAAEPVAAEGGKPQVADKVSAPERSATKNANTATARPDGDVPPAPADSAAGAADAEMAPLPADAARHALTPTAARPLAAAYTSAQGQINLPGIAFEIARQVQGGTSKFEIRLDPPELGRIDVRLDIDGGGNVKARLTVDRAETLDLLQRDQRALERALMQAGLDGKTNLEFSLKQNPFARHHDGQGRNGEPTGAGPLARGGDGDEPGPLPVTTLYRGTASAGGVNLFV